MACSSCGHVSRPGARFCASCGGGLPRPCSACGTALSPGARFCEECGAAVAESASAAVPARKVVTAVFGDLVGSTALQETLDPESARRVMARFYATMRGVIDRHGGHLDKFVGDGVVVVFGVPAVREDDALLAVRCAAAMVAELATLGDELERRWGVRLRMRTGIDTGELVIGEAGELVGDVMNTAARFEQAAAPGEVLLGEDTWRLVRHAVQLEPVAPLTLKGKAEAVRAWRLLATDSGPGQPRAETPLVGRAVELGRLRGALDAAVAVRACRLVTVIGSPGMGKTRLVAEFAATAGEQATVLLGRCEPSGEGITFGPVAELLRGAGDIGEADPPDTVRDKLSALVGGERESERIVARAGSLLGTAEPASVQETFWGVRRVLEALARRSPLVVVLEDVHWAQPLLLDLVEHLAEWTRDAPILLLALARPELRDTRDALTTPGRRVSEVIELAPLRPEESRELVSGMLGQVEPPPDLLGRILATTEGNPLFLGETLRMLVDDGSLTRRGDRWVASGEVVVPPTIHALLAARIERLQPGERAVLERASVIGKQFYVGAVAELVSADVRSGLDGHLEALRRRELVEPNGTYWGDEPVYRFHHVLIRDAAYRSLLKESRAELHERFADWLTAKAGEVLGEHEEVIGYHLEQAHEYRRQLGALDEPARALGARAAAMFGSAGRRALARADLAAAVNLLGRAGSRTEADDPTLLWDWAEALLSAGDTTTAQDVADRLARSDLARAGVLAAQIALLTGAGEPEPIVERLTATAEALAAAGDGPGAAKAHHVCAEGLVQIGRLGAAEAALDRALVEARKAGDRRRITAVLAAAPRAALWGPSPVVRSSGRCLDVLRILRMTPGNRHVEAIALRCQAVLEAVRGRFGPARDILDTARTTLTELGLSWELHELAVYAGVVELLAGDPAAAEEHLSTARDGFTALGVDVGAAQAAALLSRALVDQGRDDEALEAAAFAEQHTGGDLKATITWSGARAEALARRGDHDEALALARRAVTLAEPTDALPDKAEALLALARVLRTAGETEEARAAAGQARELYQTKDHAVGLTRATELAGAPVAARRKAVPRGRAGVLADRQQPVPVAGTGVLGDRPPERAVAEWFRSVNDRDVDALAAAFAEDIVRVDHRRLGWDDIRGPDAVREHYRSGMEMWPDVRAEPDEVLARDDRVIAFSWTMRGTAADGGATCEIPLGVVALVEDGLFTAWDQYEPDDRQPMIARYAELGGGQGPLGDRPPERVIGEGFRRIARHDVDGYLDLVAEDFVSTDHRTLGWSEVDRAGLRDIVDSMLAATRDVRFDVEEVLACDDRAIAVAGAFRGTHLDGGGEFEIPYGAVYLVEGGLACRSDRYQPEDREAMLARYAELGGRRDVLGDRPPERFFAEILRRCNIGDTAAFETAFAEEYVDVDHRRFGWVTAGAADAKARLEAFLASTTEMRFEVDEVLACDDRVIAQVIGIRGASADGGGDYEIAYGMVGVVESGLLCRIERYEPDDRQPMIARYVELGGGHGPLGDHPPERVYRECLHAVAKRDLDAALDLMTDDYVMVDHRSLGWVETDKPGHRRIIESMYAAALDVRLEVDEVLACDDRFIAALHVFRGHSADGGGAFEIANGMVIEFSGGRMRRLDRYEYDDRDAMLAHYAELGGHRDVLGDRPPERFFAEYARRFAASDIDGLLDLYADDVRRVDHRALGWEVLAKHDLRASFESIFAAGSDYRFETGEVLACDDRVIALPITVHGTGTDGGGPFEIAYGLVAVIEDGRMAGADQYDPDDRQTMIARYVELGGGQGPLGDRVPERTVAEFFRRVARHDADGYAELIADDFVGVDHRALGWGETDKAGMREIVVSMLATARDIWGEMEEVLACDDRVIAGTGAFRGTHLDGGGAFEIPLGMVYLIEDGLIRRSDRFEPEDREAMLARYAELGGARAVFGDRPVERVVARMCRRWTPGNVDELIELFTDDIVRVDHRGLGYEEAHGRVEIRGVYTAMLGVSAEVHIDPEEVLACDDRVLVLRATLRGTAAEGGGEFATPCGYVFVVAEGRVQRLEQFDPDDRRAMIARYTELGGGLGPLGDHPPERVWREMARRTARSDHTVADLYADDHVTADHRKFAWTETDKQGRRGFIASLFDASLDLRIEVDEVLACDDRVIAICHAFRGHAKDGGGTFELANGVVYVIEDGLVRRADRYEYEDREGMLARYAELTDASEAGPEVSEGRSDEAGAATARGD